MGYCPVGFCPSGLLSQWAFVRSPYSSTLWTNRFASFLDVGVVVRTALGRLHLWVFLSSSSVPGVFICSPTRSPGNTWGVDPGFSSMGLFICSLLAFFFCFSFFNLVRDHRSDIRAYCRPTLGVYHATPINNHPVESLCVLVASRPTLKAYLLVDLR